MEEILLIDDDLELCELLGEYLGNEGYRVTAAHDGEAGIRQALGGSCSLVILDVMLPDCSGLEVLRTLRNTLADTRADADRQGGGGRPHRRS